MENNSENSKFEFKNDEKATDSIARVSKVPSFWIPDPRIWFLQIEAQFRNIKIIADRSKYDTVLSTIEAEILSQIFGYCYNSTTYLYPLISQEHIMLA
ncbi:hypothetical protein TNIN_285511 [Trichonephila inaurata madagascariensis]|uniref:DUF7041 domain-containing protein n=1 Tax=Trichonephila inaurata madagascariensis TaxID=2747483 RepID=A0A8X6Y0I6_9ARAC|nr:hypothetical protein TNIN_285511 [Trichonephila inaurata madagascariensis]